MYATNFMFDGRLASDFGLIPCSFDSDGQSATGGEIEYNVIKTPDRDKFTFYGSQFNSPLVWEFSIVKDPCKYEDKDQYFNQYEEDAIAEWLIKSDGYKWIKFMQEDYDDVYYQVYINMIPHQYGGQTVGFDLTVTSNCSYGFSKLITHEVTLNSTAPFNLYVHSFTNTYIYPLLVINNHPDSFYIHNEDDLEQEKTIFNGVSGKLELDCDAEIISGITSTDSFNWYYPRLVKGRNKITTDSASNIQIKIQYREPRRVII